MGRVAMRERRCRVVVPAKECDGDRRRVDRVAGVMPLAGAAAEVWSPSESGGGRIGSSKGGAILVVDDDAAVREVVAEFLEEAGYLVLQADGGREALRLLSESTGVIMMISDIRMPDMSGIELAEAALGIRDLKIILISGYFQPQMIKQRFLRKPFRMRELEAAVRAELMA
jgi:CheY-like chemotaxis protein